MELSKRSKNSIINVIETHRKSVLMAWDDIEGKFEISMQADIDVSQKQLIHEFIMQAAKLLKYTENNTPFTEQTVN